MNWKPWLRGLGAAVITAIATAVVSSLNGANWKAAMTSAAVAAVLAAAGYLLKSPLPDQTAAKLSAKLGLK